MKQYEIPSKALPWFTVLALGVLATGCGGGGAGGQGPILGGVSIAPVYPLVTGVTPLPNATGVPVNTKVVTAAFTKAMDSTTLNTASFTLACGSATAMTGTSVSYFAAGKLASLSLPAANLPPSTLCTATVTAGVKDSAGFAMTDNFIWRFTTGLSPDTTPPMVSSTINPNLATNVATNTKVGASFTEALDPTTVNTSTFVLRQGTTVVPGTVAYSGVSAVFVPNAPLAANTAYQATLAAGIKDAAGNPMGADYNWSWTTAGGTDTTAPTVTGTIHNNGDRNVALNTQIGATFSEGMNPQSVNATNFTVMQGTTVIPGVISYSGVSAVFTPLSNLTPNTAYTVTVKGGANGVTDLAGNPLQNDFVIGWTTIASTDTTPPMVNATINPQLGRFIATNTRVGASFTEALDPLTVNSSTFVLREGNSTITIPGTVTYSGVNAVYRPNAPLANNTVYHATISGSVKDLAGNPMGIDYDWRWTTLAGPDATAPTVTETINNNGDRNVAINTRIGVSFSENMEPLTVTSQNFRVTQGTTVVAGVISYADVSAVFTPLNNLAPNTLYTVTLKGGANGLTDLADNPLQNDFVYSWTTSANTDTTAPTVTGTLQTNGQLNVATNAKVSVTFSEPVNPLTLTTASFSLKQGTTVIPGTVSYSGLTAVLTPQNTLNPNTGYTVTVKAGANGVTDVANNPLAVDLVYSWTTAVAP